MWSRFTFSSSIFYFCCYFCSFYWYSSSRHLSKTLYSYSFCSWSCFSICAFLSRSYLSRISFTCCFLYLASMISRRFLSISLSCWYFDTSAHSSEDNSEVSEYWSSLRDGLTEEDRITCPTGTDLSCFLDRYGGNKGCVATTFLNLDYLESAAW